MGETRPDSFAPGFATPLSDNRLRLYFLVVNARVPTRSPSTRKTVARLLVERDLQTADRCQFFVAYCQDTGGAGVIMDRCKVKCAGPTTSRYETTSGLIRVTKKTKGNLAYDATIRPRKMGMNRWLQLPEIAKLFGLSEDSIKRLAKNHGLPLRRVSPLATPGALESELVEWLKGQPLVGPPVRPKRGLLRKRQ